MESADKEFLRRLMCWRHYLPPKEQNNNVLYRLGGVQSLGTETLHIGDTSGREVQLKLPGYPMIS